jgi:hypothetical protein
MINADKAKVEDILKTAVTGQDLIAEDLIEEASKVVREEVAVVAVVVKKTHKQDREKNKCY